MCIIIILHHRINRVNINRHTGAELVLVLVPSCCEPIWTLVLALRALCQQTEMKPNEPTVCSLLCQPVCSSVLKGRAGPGWARPGRAGLGRAGPGWVPLALLLSA